MNRRSFFTAIAEAAPVAAVAAVAAPPTPDLSRWKIGRYTDPVPCDCYMCSELDFDAWWSVFDRATAVERYLCDKCMEDFRRSPVPFLESQPRTPPPLGINGNYYAAPVCLCGHPMRRWSRVWDGVTLKSPPSTPHSSPGD